MLGLYFRKRWLHVADFEVGGDGGLVDDAFDDVADEVGHGQHHKLVGGALHRDGVGDDELVHHGLFEFVEGVAGEEGVGTHHVNLLGTALLDAGRGFADSAARVDDVIEENHILAFHVADDLQVGDLVGFHSLFKTDGEVAVEDFGEDGGALGAARVGGNDAEVVPVEAADIGEENGGCEKVVNGNFKETLDLVGVKVHGDEAVDAGCGEQVGHQLGTDGGSRLVLPVLARVAEVGNHGDNLGGGGALGGVNQNQQLEDVLGRGEGGLDDEDVPAADGFVVIGLNFAVLELNNFLIQKVKPQMGGNLLCQRTVGPASNKSNFRFHKLLVLKRVVEKDDSRKYITFSRLLFHVIQIF